MPVEADILTAMHCAYLCAGVAVLIYLLAKASRPKEIPF
jgi:hypothetical protein